MSSSSRTLLFSATLLFLFVAAAFAMRSWLLQQTVQLRQETARTTAELVLSAAALAPRAPSDWDEPYLAQLGRLIGGSVRLERADSAATTDAVGSGNEITFARPLPGHEEWIVRGRASSPALVRLQAMHQHGFTALVLLGLALAAVPVLLALFGPRRAESVRPQWAAARAEASGIERFARLTVERGAALDREHDARLRAEENLQVSRTQLDHSLEERIRLGRELHDNMSQTLYAVALTLESVRKNMTAAPAIEKRLDQCMAELRRLNQEVRTHIRELEPEQVRSEPFATALAALLAAVAASDGVQIDHRIEEDALHLIPPQHTADLINIVREALSNSVRHGGARRVTLRAARGDSAVALAISDDGNGFDSDSISRTGRGLANMQARAAAIGGSLQVESIPGKGTRVLLTLPFVSAT